MKHKLAHSSHVWDGQKRVWIAKCDKLPFVKYRRGMDDWTICSGWPPETEPVCPICFPNTKR